MRQELGKLKAEVNQLRAAEALQLDEMAQMGKDPGPQGWMSLEIGKLLTMNYPFIQKLMINPRAIGFFHIFPTSDFQRNKRNPHYGNVKKRIEKVLVESGLFY